jgi:methylenetetrahydrofolate reductase (NADPH)
MKAAELWKTGKRPTLSFEFFPPRTEKGAETLERVIGKLADLNPDFVTVTFGAGGNTRQGSRELVEKLKNEKGLDVIAYFAGYGLGPEDIGAILDDYQSLGVENILAVRGDAPEDETFRPHEKSFAHASDLISFIKSRYSFCVGVAGYPEGHKEAQSLEKDIEYLKLKVDQGAEFVIANYFYDNRYFFDFLQRCRDAGITVPIIAGVMPIYSVKMMNMLAGLCGATITEKVRQGIADIPEDDKEALTEFGIEHAVNQCADLLRNGVQGLQFYTMDRSKSVAAIVSRLRELGNLEI